MIKEAGYEPIHIALEEFDQTVIGINTAPFFARQRLGWRKFLSSLNDETLLKEVTAGVPKAMARPSKEYSVLKCSRGQQIFPETTH